MWGKFLKETLLPSLSKTAEILRITIALPRNPTIWNRHQRKLSAIKKKPTLTVFHTLLIRWEKNIFHEVLFSTIYLWFNPFFPFCRSARRPTRIHGTSENCCRAQMRVKIFGTTLWRGDFLLMFKGLLWCEFAPKSSFRVVLVPCIFSLLKPVSCPNRQISI